MLPRPVNVAAVSHLVKLWNVRHAGDFKLPRSGLEYSGSAFQLRMRSRALQFLETSTWQWRGQQNLYQQFLSLALIRGPPFNLPGGGAEVFVAEKLFISTRLTETVKFYHNHVYINRTVLGINYLFHAEG